MSTPWWLVSIGCPPERSDEVAAALIELTGQGVHESAPGEMGTIVSDQAWAGELVQTLRDRFAGLEARISALEPVDWSTRWRDGIVARRFGRLLVTPSWLPVPDDPGMSAVIIDPESAFGSGEHGSTRAALALLERHLDPGDRVLDFGSGSGILAIAAVVLGAASAVGIEVDEEAMPIAEANAARNKVADRVVFLTGDAASMHALVGPVELLCSNILRTVNVLLLDAIEAALLPDGVAIFSGMEEMEEELFTPVLQSRGWQVVDTVTDSGWWAVAARRPG